LILDEPTTGLDYREQGALMEVLARLNRAGQTVVIITHVPWIVGTYADRAVLLNDGTVLHDGDVAALFADEELCRRADFVPPDVSRLATRLGVAARDVDDLLASLE
jgi:energy-coupling factor transport system ATP-binding protein